MHECMNNTMHTYFFFLDRPHRIMRERLAVQVPPNHAARRRLDPSGGCCSTLPVLLGPQDQAIIRAVLSYVP